MAENNEFNETEKEFYKNVAKVASTVNERLHGSISPGGTNDTVDPEEDADTSTQTDLDQESK